DDEELLLRFPVRQRGDRFLECGWDDVLVLGIVLGIGGFDIGCGSGTSCGVGGSGPVGGDRWLGLLVSFGRCFGLLVSFGRCLGFRIGIGRCPGLCIGLRIGGLGLGSLGIGC